MIFSSHALQKRKTEKSEGTGAAQSSLYKRSGTVDSIDSGFDSFDSDVEAEQGPQVVGIDPVYNGDTTIQRRVSSRVSRMPSWADSDNGASHTLWHRLKQFMICMFLSCVCILRYYSKEWIRSLEGEFQIEDGATPRSRTSTVDTETLMGGIERLSIESERDFQNNDLIRDPPGVIRRADSNSSAHPARWSSRSSRVSSGADSDNGASHTLQYRLKQFMV